MARRVFRVINPERIDLRMREKHVTSADLARCAGYGDHSYVARMRRGEKRARTVTELAGKRIAERLDMPFEYFFVEIDRSTGHPVSTPVDVKPVVSAGAA